EAISIGGGVVRRIWPDGIPRIFTELDIGIAIEPGKIPMSHFGPTVESIDGIDGVLCLVNEKPDVIVALLFRLEFAGAFVETTSLRDRMLREGHLASAFGPIWSRKFQQVRYAPRKVAAGRWRYSINEVVRRAHHPEILGEVFACNSNRLRSILGYCKSSEIFVVVDYDVIELEI